MPSATASTPSPTIGRASKRSSAPTCRPSIATRADGCPSAALLDEIARRPAATREAFTTELLAIAEDIAARLDSIDAEAARTHALGLFGMMIGTLQLARALTDRELSDQLLARGVETALRLVDDCA